MDWTPDTVTTYIDGNWVWTMDIPRFCTGAEFHELALDSELGGRWNLPGLPDPATSPATHYAVDYVRVYASSFRNWVARASMVAVVAVAVAVAAVMMPTLMAMVPPWLGVTAMMPIQRSIQAREIAEVRNAMASAAAVTTSLMARPLTESLSGSISYLDTVGTESLRGHHFSNGVRSQNEKGANRRVFNNRQLA